MREEIEILASRFINRSRDIWPMKTIAFSRAYDIMRTIEYCFICQGATRSGRRTILTMISKVATARTTAMGRFSNPNGLPPDAVNA
ncbi:hypothetical protein Mal15_60120 [Stieleria maiorica]|uniref:Uncharacterized protein n=1 Tax=Stieleria maiorica TaxID=2795974 RepID=A0A5B9MPB1_9BACT|nr:hypothetical protein Mal15_60120 [Stieleria maiorica]